MHGDLVNRPWQRVGTPFYQRVATAPAPPAPLAPAINAPRREPELDDRELPPVADQSKFDDQPNTLLRLFRSRHVKDLRWIALIAIALIGIVIWQLIHPSTDKTLDSFLSVAGPAFAAVGAVCAWCYRTGNARLGVVDLFGCEISTLCRVVAVSNTISRLVDKFGKAPAAAPVDANPPGADHFTSQENYFPVFENNTQDLQVLHARVVMSITAFYTYMKAVRDTMRQLADTPLPCRNHAVRNVLFMMFLSLESAREAIEDLFEYEPDRTVRIIEILIGELQAYDFLRKNLLDDPVRHDLIMMRESDYRVLVPELKTRVEDLSHASPRAWQWKRAERLLPKLEARFEAAMSVA